ncbi:MAG: hypothetical protein U1E87_01020 [Alphaproteobacteria bacterium]
MVFNRDDPRLVRLERSQRAAWIWDPRGRRILWATRQAAELWGLEDAFLLIDRPFGASDPSTADLDLASSALSHTEGVETEIRLVHSGRPHNIEVMGRLFARTDEGDLVLFTHQPAIGAERGETHPIAPLFNPFPLGLALFTPLGKLLYANPVYERLVGRERAHLTDLLGSQKGAERFVRALLAAGSLRLTPTLTLDGISRTLQIDAALAEDPRSHRAAFLVEAHDVTARRLHERALAERQGLLKDLLGEAIEGWTVLDRHERVIAFGGRMLEDAPGSDTTIGLPWREAAKIFAISGADAETPARLARREARASVRVAHEAALIEAQRVMSEEGGRAGYHIFLRAGAPRPPRRRAASFSISTSCRSSCTTISKSCSRTRARHGSLARRRPPCSSGGHSSISFPTTSGAPAATGTILRQRAPARASAPAFWRAMRADARSISMRRSATARSPDGASSSPGSTTSRRSWRRRTRQAPCAKTALRFSISRRRHSFSLIATGASRAPTRKRRASSASRRASLWSAHSRS